MDFFSLGKKKLERSTILEIFLEGPLKNEARCDLHSWILEVYLIQRPRETLLTQKSQGTYTFMNTAFIVF